MTRSRVLVLDAAAIDALATAGSVDARSVARAVVVAARLRHAVVVPSVVLAECQRGAARTSRVDALLAREPGLRTRDTDRRFARLVGGVLHAVGAGSELLADAHCVAAAVEAGGGVVITSDPSDLRLLAGPHPQVIIETIS